MRSKLVAAVATGVLVLAGGCSSAGEDQPSTGGGAVLDKVTFETAFGAAGRGADVFVANAKGYFKEAGIQVDIQLGQSVEKNMGNLEAGKAQFGEFDSTGAIIQAGKGNFPAVRMIAGIHNGTLASIITLDPTITNPRDLAGRKIGVAPGGVNEVLFPAYARLAGLDPKTVTVVKIKSDSLNSSLAGNKVDALSTFLLAQKNIEKAAGGKHATVMPYNKYLSDTMGNALATTTKVIQDKPDLVKRFRDATLKGLKYAIEHPDEAAEIVHAAQPATSVAAAKSELVAMTPYVTSADGVLGAMPENRIVKIIELLRSLALFVPDLPASRAVDFTFTDRKSVV